MKKLFNRKSKKETVAFMHTQTAGITMYRFNNYAKYIKGMNVMLPDFDIKGRKVFQEWEFFINEKSVLEDLNQLIHSSDMIVFQRSLNTQPVVISIIDAIKEHNQRTGERKLVGMDIDDYMFNVPDGNPAKGNFAVGAPLFNIGMAQLQSSDFVVCSTNYLKEAYSQYNPNCLVMGNSIDMEWWGKITNNNKGNKKIKIGWAGANGHSEDLAILDPVIDEILSKYADRVEFVILAPKCELKERKGLTIDTGFVDLNKYPNKLKSLGLDIGIVPLVDHQFNRSKSAIRYMELSLLGIPSVCSNIGGEFNEAIVHGENGYLARNTEEFVKHLSELIENEQLRKDMGKLALENVLKNYNAKSRAEQYVAMLKEARRKTDEIRCDRGENINPTPTVAR